MRTTLVCLLLGLCLPSLGQDFGAGYPAWQRLLATGMPEAWHSGDSFNRVWQGRATLVRAVPHEVSQPVYRIEDLEPPAPEDGTGPAPAELPGDAPKGSPLSLVELVFQAGGDTVRLLLPAPTTLPQTDVEYAITLRSQVGFGGTARGLILRDADGLALLYDDGGYGPGFRDASERAGLGVSRAPSAGDAREAWESLAVSFSHEDSSLTVAEGSEGALGKRLSVRVLVSRVWRGRPPTDIDLAPLAYLVSRGR